MRRVPDSQFAPSEPGRPIPLNDTPRPLSFIGPLPVNADGTLGRHRAAWDGGGARVADASPS